MRVPLSWLREYVDIDLTPEQLAARLAMLGMEVKAIDAWRSDLRDIVVGELLSVQPHPRADRLTLTTVRVDERTVLEIVCGATNIAAGQRVPVALPGAILPGGRRIEATEKMGVLSNGMLCSGDELQLTGDAEGILILPEDASVGSSLADLYGDVVLDVDVKPNRGDALSFVGLGREVAAATGAELRIPEPRVVESGISSAERLHVSVKNPELCERFVARWISGVGVGPAPNRIQIRLRAAGLRPVSNVVDATNYVMLELGKPTHAFDAASVEDGTIVVRSAQRGERLETLDHVVRELGPETLVIADRSRPLAIAGVMGGADSEVSASTTDVILESAIFDPVSIRRTGQRFGLRSEASLRFEKGQEMRLAATGADRVAQFVTEWAGGTAAPGRIDTHPAEPVAERRAFRPVRVNALLGTELTGDEQRALLARVGIETEPSSQAETIIVSVEPQPHHVVAAPGDAVAATIPSWRHDLQIEADLIEEIVRVRGFEHVPATLPDTAPPHYRPSPTQLRDSLRDALAGAGLTEIVTPALVSPELVAEFGLVRPSIAPPPGEGEAVGVPIQVANPLSSQHSVLRQSLLGSLLETVPLNSRHGREDVAIFEIGKGYGRDGNHPVEWWRLGFAMVGAAEPAAWNRAARSIDIDDAKGLVELIGRRLGGPEPTFEPERDCAVLHPGRAARVALEDLLSGLIGELHPSIAAARDLRGKRVILGELAIRGLSGGQAPVVQAVPIGRYPSVERDIAVVVASSISAAAVAGTIKKAAGPLLADCRLFDVYRGAPLSVDETSLAERLVFQSPERTLTDKEIDEAIASIAAELGASLGARLRT